MQDSFNPYASPTALEMKPAASEWVGTSDKSLQKVASGLGLIRKAAIVWMATMLLYVAYVVFVAFGRVGRWAWLFPVFYAGMVVVVRIMNVLGGVRCLSTPSELRGRRWVLAYVAVALPSLFVGMADVISTGSRASLFVQHLLTAVVLATFMLYLRQLGLSIGRTDLARRAIRLLILWMVAVGLSLARIAGAHLYLPVADFWGGPGIRVEAVWVAHLVVGIVGTVKDVNLLAAMKSAILTGR